jgi:hypothetical protein
MAARRTLLLRLPVDDAQRLDILAVRRDMTPAELAEQVLLTWLDGPGHAELVTALLHRRPRSRSRRSEAAGQLSLVE